ncbi:preprotein translocase subunit YajC [Poriferisphaera corsica]|uniref:Sec translocon accessory complex subunit YajC n=1 Tax=Poriferisphaera corsica TaxID=2528020 RepID=A0A517YX21_9BACT|nr:preprotein translocase subunit YajC [Poriferisphaera corsica]QDU34764.1 preprotein translocase subunit YajC [Poriferisphaera corsica]
MLDKFLATYTLAQTEESGPPTLNTVTQEGAATTQADGSPDASGGNGNGTAPAPTGGGNQFLFVMIAVLAVVWFFMIRANGKDKKKKAALVASMKKGSKVQTIGGVLGTIVDIRDDVVVVKIDENNNTRMRFNRTAIQTVIDDKEKE